MLRCTEPAPSGAVLTNTEGCGGLFAQRVQAADASASGGISRGVPATPWPHSDSAFRKALSDRASILYVAYFRAGVGAAISGPAARAAFGLRIALL